MRLTRFLSRTFRDDPTEAETPSHRLMLRAGMLQQVASGIYSYPPLAQRSLNKITAIIREEMDRAGGQEITLPNLQPIELWEKTGRDRAFGADMIRFPDRRSRTMVLAPTHEEAVTLLASQFIQSYRDIPILLYQIQSKFRDELRPRAGLIRVREFDMNDSYSFDADTDALDSSYTIMIQAYNNIFARCGIPATMVEAESGAIGGKDSHEFILPTAIGEDTFLQCPNCKYAANIEKAVFKRIVPPKQDESQMQVVSTPGIETIESVASFFDVAAEKVLKTVFYQISEETVLVTIRGDLDVNESKLKRIIGNQQIRISSPKEVKDAGLVPGYASPIGLHGFRTIADESITHGSNFVAGSNEPGSHIKNVNYPRDFTVELMADIALAKSGDNCDNCGTMMESQRGIEVGHVFKLGSFFSEHLGATYLDQSGQQRPLIMGCYGIGVGRLLAAAIEHNHDDDGLLLPNSIAPFQVYLVTLNTNDPNVLEQGEKIYHALTAKGIEVLFDDRIESPGVKLKDADLLGFPLRIVISARTIQARSVEVKPRLSEQTRLVPSDDIVTEVGRILEKM